MRKFVPVFLLALAAAQGIQAENVSDTGIVDIPPAEWRDMALGRTLIYTIEGDFFALERYAQSGNRVELQLSSGECLSGTWSHEGTAYCFDWGDATPACFRHTWQGGRVVIIQLENGEETSLTQVMTGITDTPLTCAGNMS